MEATVIDRIISAVHPAFALCAACELDVFTPLAESPKNAEELADVLGVDAAKLRVLLYLLVTAQLLTVDEGRFANTPEADHFLVKHRPGYMGSRSELWAEIWPAELKTAESIRMGRAQGKKDFATMPTDERDRIFRGLHSGAIAAGHELVRAYDFSAYQTLVDVGGGSGGLVIALAEILPSLRLTVADQPEVVPTTRRFLTEAGLAGRISVVPVDIVHKPLPGRFDAAVLKALIQVLSAEDARTALQNVSRGLAPGGDLYIVGSILDDSRLTPAETAAFNLVFINVYDGGQAYTEGEYRSWLEEAGFERIERSSLPGGFGLITARKRSSPTSSRG
jgi:ubiquinone/menaquinone biosynthesis C-methylase UbiE